MSSRQGISTDQRRALRRWAHRQYPKPTQKQCIEWFQNEYNHKLSQSTVSESLSKHFSHLDNCAGSENLRLREGNWPDLEKLLFGWQQRVEAQGAITSNDLLQLKAREIWKQLPQYSTKTTPGFSAGWLEGFKKRFNITSRVRHGEAGSVPQIAKEEMKALQTIAGEYQEEDIYNMDESALFWRMMLSRGLLSRSLPGVKKNKSRISLVFCVNATGTDRLPVWFIGKAKQPRALKGISVSTMGGQWRWNPKGWMNFSIMEEWLQAFYQHVGTTRRILLTMDNFSAHYSGIRHCPPPSNIQICWLPANSTSRYQPLNQGIIQNCKAFYRQRWLQYILRSFDLNTDPQITMNIHLAIRWILRSWNSEITNNTIYNCFRKSTLVSSPISLTTTIIPLGFEELYNKVRATGHILDAMTISNFLNPIEEEEVEEEKDGHNVDMDSILQEVIDDHLGLQSAQNDDDENEQAAKPTFTVGDAQQAVQVLIGFTEAQEHFSTDYIRFLERYEMKIEAIQDSSRVQSTLDSWIM